MNGEFFDLLSEPSVSNVKNKHRSDETKSRGSFGEN